MADAGADLCASRPQGVGMTWGDWLPRVELRSARQMALTILSAAVCIVVVRMISDAHRSRERERLIGSLVNQHQIMLSVGPVADLGSALEQPWLNESPVLQAW